MAKDTAVIIPVRRGGSPEITLRSLARQTYRHFDVIISWDEGRGASWARNRGAEMAGTASFLLFCDDDIDWYPDALDRLAGALLSHPEAAFSFGTWGDHQRSSVGMPFSAENLRHDNYISTMSLIRREAFPGWDESIQRLQDWDLWLTIAGKNLIGVQCGAVLFRTKERDGITHNGPMSYGEARSIVARKHGIS